MNEQDAPESALPDIASRREAGKEVRKTLPRSGLADWTLRDRDPVAILRSQDESRVTELVPLRYGRMLVSPFTFYRGAAAIMADDLGSQADTGLLSQLAGDAHMSNFGGYASPERDFVFDVNDFDETHLGPFEWDLKRLLTSLIIASRENGAKGRKSLKPALHAAATYRRAMAGFANSARLDVWYARLDEDAIIRQWAPTAGPRVTQDFRRNVERARRKTSQRAAKKMTRVVDGQMRFVSNPPLLTPMREMLTADGYQDIASRVRKGWHRYLESLQPDLRHLASGYRFVDLARKVVGVGSVGTRCYIALFVGAKGDGDPLVLQLKEAVDSVLHPFVPEQGEHGNHGRRVVDGQRLMQAASDIFLGWTKINDQQGVERDFYVRQLWDWKGSADMTLMAGKGMEAYAQMCGWTLARAHARSGDRYAVSAYLGRSEAADRSLVQWADRYVSQNQADYERVKSAAADGSIPYEEPPEGR